MKSKICLKDNDFHIGFVDIGLKNVVVAATRVVDLPSRSIKRGAILVDVRKTNAKRLISVGVEAAKRGTASTSL